jgi:hypothetical protein
LRLGERERDRKEKERKGEGGSRMERGGEEKVCEGRKSETV